MKVSAVHDTESKKLDAPLLPLIPDHDKKSDAWMKEHTLTFNLRTNPADAGSDKYKFTIQILDGSETLREALRFIKDIIFVAQGLGAADAGQKDGIIQRCLKDNAHTHYTARVAVERKKTRDAAIAQIRIDHAADDARIRREIAALPDPAPLTDAHVEAGLQAVIEYMAPYKCLARVKRYLRRSCRKPLEMPIKEFYNHFTRINTQELPNLPPFDADQHLSDDEVVDILLYATPKSWYAEMQRQGFDPFSQGPDAVVDFMERIEAAEVNEKQMTKVQSKDSKKKGSSSSKKQKGSNSLYCEVHGKGNHSTADCLAIKNLKDGKSSGKSSGKKTFKNKTWTRKADEAEKESKKEISLLIGKVVRKELNAMLSDKKKRKARGDAHMADADDADVSDQSDHSSDGGDSDDDHSVNMMDRINENLDKFNFNDMDNIHVDDKEDGEVTDEFSV